MTTHTLMLMALALTTAACSTASASPPKEQPAEPSEDRSAAQSATPPAERHNAPARDTAERASDKMCVASLTLPAPDAVYSADGHCPTLPRLLESRPTRLEYPCDGGPAQALNEAGDSITHHFNAFRVSRDSTSLIVEAHYDPYLIYGCHTRTVERLVTDLETGASTYTYADDWGASGALGDPDDIPEHCRLTCPAVELLGAYLKPIEAS